MSDLTDRAAYLRGLAEGMNLDKDKSENRLMLEMLSVMEEMAQKLSEMDADISELDEYVESIDADLNDMEEAFFSDDDLYDEEEDSAFDEKEELSFDCPHCGNPMRLKASDIDFDQSPVCPKCDKTFFPGAPKGEDD